MTRPDWIETLRADLRPADPDPVLLAQLARLSAHSTVPDARPGRSAGARLAMVLGGAIAVGATSWAAGALPGTESPFGPEERITHQPTDPTPEGVRTPPTHAPASPADVPSSAPGGDAQVPSPDGSPPADGDPPEVPRSADPTGGPPGPPIDLPSLPDLPLVPEVPVVPEPPGLDRVPDLPTTP